MAVKIRMKKMGRTHRPFFRICATDGRKPRDGRVIEELGFYDPMIKETDARAVLKSERIDYWLGVGAQPSDKVKVLIKKYGTNGSHLEQQAAALEKLKIRPVAPEPVKIELPKPEEPAAAAPAEGAAAEGDAPAADAPAKEEAKAEEPKADAPAEEPKAEAKADEAEAKAKEAPAEEAAKEEKKSE